MTQTKTVTTETTTGISNSFLFGGFNLDLINSNHKLVPQSAQEIIISPDHAQALAIAIKNNYPALLLGDTGIGKTSAVKWIAYKLKQPYVRVNMTGYTSPDELIGSKSVADGATYYEEGVITNAMKIGAILVIDEINATNPDCLFIIHGLLDDDKQVTLPNGEVIKPNPKFRVFATGNLDYEGTKSMNRAFLDRFPIILEMSALQPPEEAKLLADRTGIDPKIATELIKCGVMARKAYQDQKTLTYVSTRSLLQMANLIKNGVPTSDAYKISIQHKAQKEEQEAFKDIYNAVFEKPIADANEEIIITTKGKIDSLNDQISRSYQEKQDLIRERDEHIKELGELRLLQSQSIRKKKVASSAINVGDIVTIRSSSPHHHQQSRLGNGIVASVDIDNLLTTPSGDYIKITFQNGYRQAYRLKDLSVTHPKVAKSKTKSVKRHVKK